MSTLWAYGDSHTAGAELGCTVDFNQWLENHKHLPTQTIREKWNDYLIDSKQYTTLINNNPCAPEYSYAGILADMLGYSYNCKAEPGLSNDGCLLKMLDDRKDWKDDDVVLWGITTPLRFKPMSNLPNNHQIKNMPLKVAKVMLTYGPHENSYKLWNQGLMHLFGSLHRNTICVRMNNDDISINNFYNDSMLATKTSLLSCNLENNHSVYPGSHYHRITHEYYAKLIYEGINNET